MQHNTSHQFVNREEEQQLVARCVHDIQHGIAVSKCIINFYGLPGIGKTALFQQLRQNVAAEQSFVTLAINLAMLEHGESLEQAKHQFLQALLDPAQLFDAPDELVQRLEQMPLDDAQLNLLVEEIVAHLSSLNRPLLLLLDSWDDVPDALFAWVERVLLLPLLHTERLIAVLSSRTALRWRQFGVRRRVQSVMLTTLDVEATRQQTGLDDSSVQQVFALTCGHPFANEVALNHLSSGPASEKNLDGHAPDVATAIVDALLERTLTGRATEFKRIFEVLALFREFDIDTLRTFLPRFLPEYANYSQSALLASLKSMQEARLVGWNNEKRAYEIDPTVRRILVKALRLNDPERYALIRAAAVEYYTTLIEDVSGSRNTYLLEYYYHLLSYNHADGIQAAEVQGRFAQFLRRYFVSPDGHYLDTEALNELRGMIQDDEELTSVLDDRQLSCMLLIQAITELESSAIPSAS